MYIYQHCYFLNSYVLMGPILNSFNERQEMILKIFNFTPLKKRKPINICKEKNQPKNKKKSYNKNSIKILLRQLSTLKPTLTVH